MRHIRSINTVTVAALLATSLLTACTGGDSNTVGTPGPFPVIVADVPIPNSSGTNVAFSFDLFYVDQGKGAVYFTDRNNKSVDKITYSTSGTFVPSPLLAAQFSTGLGFSGCNSAPGVPAPGCPSATTAAGPVSASANSGPNGVNGLAGTTRIYSADVQKIVGLDSVAGALVATIPATNPILGNTGIRTDEGCILPAANSPIAGAAILAYSNNGEPTQTKGGKTLGTTYYTFVRLDTNAVVGQMVMPNSVGQEQCAFDTTGPGPVTMLYAEDGDTLALNTITGTANPDGAMDSVNVAALFTAFATAPVSAANGYKWLVLDLNANVAADTVAGFYPVGAAGMGATVAAVNTIWNRVTGYNTTVGVAAGSGCGPTGFVLNSTAGSVDAFQVCRPAAGVVANVLVLNRKTGAVKANVNAGAGDQVAYDPVTNAYYVASSRWNATGISQGSCSGTAPRVCTPVMNVVDGTSYAVRARLPVGNNAHGVDVDSAAGFAFMAYSNSTLPAGCGSCTTLPAPATANGGVHVIRIR